MIVVCSTATNACFSGVNDLTSMIDEVQAKIVNLGSNKTIDVKKAEEVANSLVEGWENPDERIGLKTGIPSIDKHMDFVGGQLIILAGRPAMGKSSLQRNIIQRFSEDGNKCGLFTPEMPERSQMIGFYSQLTGIPNVKLKQALRKKVLDKYDFQKVLEAREVIESWNLLIEDKGPIDMPTLRKKARWMKLQGVRAIFIDQANKINPQISGNDREIVSRSVKEVGALSLELDIPFFLLAQINREAEKNKNCIPRLSNLKETGSFEEEANAVLFIHRDYYYTNRAEDKGKGVIIIAKHREGPPGKIDCNFSEKRTLFTEAYKQGY
jgi:replicative DNA helicase